MPNVSNKDYFKSIIGEMQPNHRDKFPLDLDTLTGNLVWSVMAGDLEIRREFFTKLLHKFIASVSSRRIFNNRLSQFTQDATNMTGAIVEEYHIDKLDAVKVNLRHPSELLKLEPLTVRDTYHTINRPLEKYAYTLSSIRMRKAILNENGLTQFIEDAARTLDNSYQKDNQDYMLRIIGDYIQTTQTKDRLFSVHCDFDTTSPAGMIEEQVKKIAAEARTLYRNFEIDMTRAYNPMNVMQFSEAGEILIFIKPELEAYMSVFVQALAYNVDNTNFLGNIIVVPNFGANADPDALACVTTTEFFKSWLTVQRYSTFFDPDLQVEKYYLHVEGIYSSSFFENFAMITKGIGTEVPYVSINRFGVQPNGSYILPFGSIIDSNSENLIIAGLDVFHTNQEEAYGVTLEYTLSSYQGEVENNSIADIEWDERLGTGKITVNGNGYITMTARSIWNPQVYRTMRYELRYICPVVEKPSIVITDKTGRTYLNDDVILSPAGNPYTTTASGIKQGDGVETPMYYFNMSVTDATGEIATGDKQEELIEVKADISTPLVEFNIRKIGGIIFKLMQTVPGNDKDPLDPLTVAISRQKFRNDL